jgi:hypothetical protein
VKLKFLDVSDNRMRAGAAEAIAKYIAGSGELLSWPTGTPASAHRSVGPLVHPHYIIAPPARRGTSLKRRVLGVPGAELENLGVYNNPRMCESEPKGAKVGEMFEAARTGAPKLKVFRAGLIGIPISEPDVVPIPSILALLKRPDSEGVPLNLLDLRGNKQPLNAATKEALLGCKRDNLLLQLPGVDKGEGESLDARHFYSAWLGTKAFVIGDNSGAAKQQVPTDPNNPFS